MLSEFTGHICNYILMYCRLARAKAVELQRHRLAHSERKVSSGVRSLQALARGRSSREALRLSASHSSMPGTRAGAAQGVLPCVECGYKAAVKHCLVCDDSFCFLCFDHFHAKGNRASHEFESLVREEVPLVKDEGGPSRSSSGDSEESVAEYAEDDGRAGAGVQWGHDGGSVYDPAGAVEGGYYDPNNGLQQGDYLYDAVPEYSAEQQQYGYSEQQQQEYDQQEYSQYDPMDYWEEYWDDAAQAKYWFNTWTGEATWLSPFAPGQSTVDGADLT